MIYFYHDPAMPLYLLMIYAKARAMTSRLMPSERYRGLWRA